jgi:cytochrome c peroxidase
MQFWDGRASDLIEQAKVPLLDPIEMAMPDENEVVNRLKNAGDYPRLFKRAFPNEQEPVTFDNTARAIAAFERTLVTPCRFDRYLKGDLDAITMEEERGLMRFVDTGCVECHGSFLVGGRQMKKFGLYHPYQNQSDMGRYAVTHNDEDRFVFKVPTLRNVTLTPPYFYDGEVQTLPEAVRIMAWMQLDMKLSLGEIDEIICFLNTLDSSAKYKHLSRKIVNKIEGVGLWKYKEGHFSKKQEQPSLVYAWHVVKLWKPLKKILRGMPLRIRSS